MCLNTLLLLVLGQKIIVKFGAHNDLSVSYFFQQPILTHVILFKYVVEGLFLITLCIVPSWYYQG